VELECVDRQLGFQLDPPVERDRRLGVLERLSRRSSVSDPELTTSMASSTSLGRKRLFRRSYAAACTAARSGLRRCSSASRISIGPTIRNLGLASAFRWQPRLRTTS
jgi:hypothetical protein